VYQCYGDSYGGEMIVQKRVPATSGTKIVQVTASGIADAKGRFLLPQTFYGDVFAYQYFFVAEAKVRKCCPIPGFSSAQNQIGKFLIFDRKGIQMLPYLVDGVPEARNDPHYAIFKREKKKGILTKSGFVIEPEFNEIKGMEYGWLFVKKGDEWGVMRCKEAH
jgi:hypothetical protein